MTERTSAVVVALRLEALAMRRHTDGVQVLRTGLGPRGVARSATRLESCRGWVSSGLCGGLAPGVRAGDLVVADEIVSGELRYAVPAGPVLAEWLRARGVDVHVGSVAAAPEVVHGAERARLARAGHVAVDMESGALAELAAGRAFVVIRSVVDTADAPLLRPGTPIRAWRALRSLRIVAPYLGAWARTTDAAFAGPEEVG
jgi:4-hydroxy-3-methylbut-2-enyl diphosphate reductase